MKMKKRIAALFLALAMALSIMAVPAMAYGPDEGVAPCGSVGPIVGTCPICGQEMVLVGPPGSEVAVCLNTKGHNGI